MISAAMRHQPCGSLLAPDLQTGFVDMTESPMLASQFRPVAQFWLERYLDTVEVSGSSPDGPTIRFNHLRQPTLLPGSFMVPKRAQNLSS